MESKLEAKKSFRLYATNTHYSQQCLLEGNIMAPLSAGTGRRALRGFGLKLQQSRALRPGCRLSPQPRPTFTCPTYLSTHFFLLPFLPCVFWEGVRRPRVDRVVDEDGTRLEKKLEDGLSAPVFSPALLEIVPTAVSCFCSLVVPASCTWFSV